MSKQKIIYTITDFRWRLLPQKVRDFRPARRRLPARLALSPARLSDLPLSGTDNVIGDVRPALHVRSQSTSIGTRTESAKPRNRH